MSTGRRKCVKTQEKGISAVMEDKFMNELNKRSAARVATSDSGKE